MWGLRVLLAAATAAMWAVAAHAQAVDCAQFNIDSTGSKALGGPGQMPESCTVRMKRGFPVPDPNCTPGAINPTLTTKVLRNPKFTTKCVRNNVTSQTEKGTTYDLYSITHPEHNQGVMQICELDHLVSLELGGADTLDNIWPQCGPSRVVLIHRFFKQKDIVENFLAKQVRDGVMNLADAQKGIASDWTQFIDDARQACTTERCRDSLGD